MNKKLPNSTVTARCGVCFNMLVWNAVLKQFECSECQIKVTCSQTGEFLTEFLSNLQVPCNFSTIHTTRVERYLRYKSDNSKFFAVYTTIHSPCSLPKCHTAVHYFPSETLYSEEPFRED